MNLVTGLARARAAAGTTAGPSRRPPRWRTGRTAQEIARFDEEFRTTLAMQIEIARRYECVFTITSSGLDVGDQSRFDPLLAVTACDRHLRVLDAVTWIDGALVVLWWNTDRAGAAVGLQRLVAKHVLPSASLQRTGIATFPVDGLTTVALMEAARRVDVPSLPPRAERPGHLHAVTTAPLAGRPEPDGATVDGLGAAGR